MTIVIDRRDVARDREAVFAWVRDHGLDPANTAPGVTIQDGQVTATVYLRNDKGERYVERHPETGDWLDVAHNIVTTPLVRPLPAGIGTEIA